MQQIQKKLFKIFSVLCVVLVPVIGYFYITYQTSASRGTTYSSEATTSADTDYKVDFKFEGLTKERQIAKSFYKKEIDDVENTMQEMGNDEDHIKIEIRIDYFDLNEDGQKEILVYLYHSAFCGTHGCSFYILEKKGTEWKEILNLTAYGEGISILKDRSNTYHDLSFEGHLTGPGPHIWNWNGKYFN